MRPLHAVIEALSNRRGPYLVGASLVAALALGCGSGDASLRPMPTPDLSSAEAGARDQIAFLRAAVERALDAADHDHRALAEAYGDLGSAYVVYEFLEAGEAAFANAVILAPDTFRWHYLLGYLAQLRGQLHDAAGHYQTAAGLEPDYAPIQLRLGRLRLEQGAADEAEALFAHTLVSEPTSAAALEGLGRVAEARGDSTEAVAYYQRALAADPSADSLEYALGQAYRRLGDLEKASDHLARRGDVPVRIPDPLINALGAIGRTAQLYLVQGAEAMEDADYQAAAGAFQHALAIDQRSFTAYRGLAVAIERLGDIEAAIGHLEAGLANASSEDAGEDRRDRGELLRTLAGMLVVAGRDPEAVEHFERALTLEPEKQATRLLLGNALVRVGRLQDALAAFDGVLASAASPAPAVLLKKATVLVNLQRPGEAKSVFEQALAAAPDDPALRLRIAEALAYLGEPAAAEAQRSAAGRLASTAEGGPAGDTVRLLLEDARARRARGELESAVTRFDQALEREPEQHGVRFELAQLLGHLGYHDDALRELRAVADAVPRHAGARRGEITVLLLLGRFGKARIRLQDALRIFPLDAELAHMQARLLASSPDPDVRDGALALEIVGRLMNVRTDLAVRETFAMALAAAGRFEDAAVLQRQLLFTAEGMGHAQDIERLRTRLARFEAGEPWAAFSGEEIVAATLEGAIDRAAG